MWMGDRGSLSEAMPAYVSSVRRVSMGRVAVRRPIGQVAPHDDSMRILVRSNRHDEYEVTHTSAGPRLQPTVNGRKGHREAAQRAPGPCTQHCHNVGGLPFSILQERSALKSEKWDETRIFYFEGMPLFSQRRFVSGEKTFSALLKTTYTVCGVYAKARLAIDDAMAVADESNRSFGVMPAQDTPPLRGGDPVVAGIHVFLPDLSAKWRGWPTSPAMTTPGIGSM